MPLSRKYGGFSMFNARRPYYLALHESSFPRIIIPHHNSLITSQITDTIFWHGPPGLTMLGSLLAVISATKIAVSTVGWVDWLLVMSNTAVF